jgi:hypothetical protein
LARSYCLAGFSVRPCSCSTTGRDPCPMLGLQGTSGYRIGRVLLISLERAGSAQRSPT